MKGYLLLSFLIGIAAAQEYICGTSKLQDLNFYVIGGTDTVPGLLPWTLKLEAQRDNVFFFECSATLIDPMYALTSARCIEDTAESYRIVAGSLGDGSEDFEQYIAVANIIVHPDFDDSLQSYPNDIAILELASAVDISEEAGPVHPICLPPTNDTRYYENPNSIASGYGVTEVNGTFPDTMKQYWIDVVRELQCELWWVTDSLLPTQQCAYDQIARAFSLCQGDLGSPLSCMVDGRFDLAGIGSVYDDECNTRWPSVYTNVPSYLDWIAEITGVQPRED